MATSVIIWLVIMGALLIASFSMGVGYLSEWKEGLTKTAYYEAESRPDYVDKKNLAEHRVQAKISLPIWIISFIVTFASVLGVFWVLTTKL